MQLWNLAAIAYTELHVTDSETPTQYTMCLTCIAPLPHALWNLPAVKTRRKTETHRLKWSFKYQNHVIVKKSTKFNSRQKPNKIKTNQQQIFVKNVITLWYVCVCVCVCARMCVFVCVCVTHKSVRNSVTL